MGLISKVLKACGGTDAAPMETGAALPDVRQRNQDGQVVHLREVGATGWLLVYFYPKADTPGCTRQACSLRDAYADLTGRGVRVLGVSADGVGGQKAFREKYALPFNLLADEDGLVASGFGVPSVLGYTKRQAFLFRDGKLVWKDLAASTDQQAADVTAVLDAGHC